MIVSKLNRKFAAKTIIMKSYGRKIIDYIFKRWAERAAICYEPERKVQADSDRSDIRVFETGLSTQQYGDHRQSTRTAEEEECLRLIKIAKEQGLYIDKSDWGKFGDRRMIPTGECIVFLSEDGTTFTKMKSPFAKASMKVGGWKYKMTKRLPDITHQVSVLKILSFPELPFLKVATHFL